jgi:hypothetical protein
MHTGHIVLVEANSAEEAKVIVEGNLMPEEGSSWADWSDWCQIGGRWADEFEGEEDSAVLCYDENPLLAEKKIKEFLQYRMNRIEQAVSVLDEGLDLVSILKSYKPSERLNLDSAEDSISLWKVNVALDLIDDVWVSQSFVYDMTYGSASVKDFERRCEEAPEKQFLVMVDFHH